jgi:hypothetical protein
MSTVDERHSIEQHKQRLLVRLGIRMFGEQFAGFRHLGT